MNVVNISWAISMRRCFRSKFSNFGTIFATASFMPKTFVRTAWHERNDMPTSSVIFLLVIQQLFKIIFFTATMFWMWMNVFDGLGRPGRVSLNRLYHNWTCVLLIADITFEIFLIHKLVMLINDSSGSKHSSKFTVLVVVVFTKKKRRTNDKDSRQSKHTTFKWVL